jgi:hypothetical protein
MVPEISAIVCEEIHGSEQTTRTNRREAMGPQLERQTIISSMSLGKALVHYRNARPSYRDALHTVRVGIHMMVIASIDAGQKPD